MMNNRLLTRLFTYKRILTLSLALALSACDSANDVSLKEQSIIYCAEGSPESFNPQTVTSGTTVDTTAKHLYDRLIAFNSDDHTIVPSIAKSWHVTRDGKRITFYLRKDISFHTTQYFTPTRMLNADDVMFSFERILNEQHEYHEVSGGSYPFFESVRFAELVQSIEKINDYTVRFNLNNSNSSFLANLATDFAVILSKEYAEQLALENRHQQIDLNPIGTGPYKLIEYRPGSLIRYYPHENYWQNKTELSQLLFDITPSNTSRLTKLLTGECDVVAYPIAHEKINERDDLILEAVTSFNVGYLGFNTQKAPFDNQEVRSAIAHAINKQAIIEAVYFGHAEQATSLLPTNSWAYNSNIKDRTYSIEFARSLLVAAGYPDGFTMDIWAMPVQRAYNPNALTMAKLIQSDLKQIGITVNIVSFEWGTFLRKLAQGEHQSVLLGWSADHPDPDNFFTPLLSCSSAESGNNRVFWCNEEFDKLLKESLATNNIGLRKKYYARALEILAKEVPLIPIAHSKRFQARSENVEGQLLHSIGGIDFSAVSKK
ncbi:ABC transporter substrate-binding protein [Thalassotalea sp. PLHSN55]|uniref:ABC transporter substrate-binding protein n=1 Tax=Thalassotalea sp. PLHSN55 TaxID=3435888 RepID=UPI003F84C46E